MADFYKMDPADWDFGTANLTLEQEAAYLRIVNAMHKHKGPVPDNDRVLAGMFRCSTRKARALIEALIEAGKVQITDGKISNERAASDLVQRGFVSSSRAEAGAKGGRTKAERASKPLENNETALALANAREEESREEKRSRDTNVSLVDHTVSDAFRLFNESAERAGWPKCSAKNKTRVSSLKRRLKEVGGIDGWRIAMEKAEASDFLCNRSSKSFTATIDFLLQESSFTKLMEGNYDNRGTAKHTDQRAERLSGMLGTFAEVARDRDGQSGGRESGGQDFGGSGNGGDDSRRGIAAPRDLLDFGSSPRNGEA